MFTRLRPGMLQRWRARHLVSFDFEHAEKPGRPHPAIQLWEPPSFSAEIQASEGGWHLPSEQGGAWLCVKGGKRGEV